MTPRPYLSRTYSQVPSHIEKAMTGMYTIHGAGSSKKASLNPTMPIKAETTCTSGIMTGGYHIG